MIKDIIIDKDIIYFQVTKLYSIEELLNLTDRNEIAKFSIIENDNGIDIDGNIEIPISLLSNFDGTIFIDSLEIKVSINTVFIKYNYSKRIHNLKKYTKKNLVDKDYFTKIIDINGSKYKIKFNSSISINSDLFINTLNKYKKKTHRRNDNNND